MTKPGKFFRENGLGLVTVGCFLVFMFGLSLAGLRQHNSELHDQGIAALRYRDYLRSPYFWEAVMENWESGFFQLGVYVILTSFLYQLGSAESKAIYEPNEVDKPCSEREMKNPCAPWPVRRGGWVLKIYANSLSLALLGLFLASFLLHALAGSRKYNIEAALHHGQPVPSMWAYILTAQFWFESFQNWQSEFLSVGAIVMLSVYLRQKGSPQSKRVASPYEEEDAA